MHLKLPRLMIGAEPYEFSAMHFTYKMATKNFRPAAAYSLKRDANCGAVPDNLIESLLFGHQKGSFTDATSDRCGHFEEAHGGTRMERINRD